MGLLYRIKEYSKMDGTNVDVSAENTTISGSIADEIFSDNCDFRAIVERSNWKPPADYYHSMPQTTREIVSAVVKSDEKLRNELRNYFPELLSKGSILAWERVDNRYIETLKQKRLYSGQVIAADGTLAKYETLSLVGAQIAVSSVGYQKHTGQFVTNIMHWGKEIPRTSTIQDIVEALQSRGKKMKNKLNNIFLHTLLTYKERQVLMDAGPGMFKLIQGTVFPYEMLSGSGSQRTMKICLELLEALIDDGSYATIVSNTAYEDQLQLGAALNAGEYIVLNTGDVILDGYYATAHYADTKFEEYGWKSQQELFKEFQAKYGSKVVQGVLRAHPMSKPYIFYCNKDRLEEAVHLLMADAYNTGPRGFPLLIDLADQYCSGAFKSSEYLNLMNAEFSKAAQGSGIYMSEHATRDYAQGS